MKLSKLKINPNNPQIFDDLSKLENSIKEFPKMMVLRPLVYDPKNMQILGGNKRLICLQNLGFKEIPDNWIRSADELTEEEKKRFVIVDNVGFGEWDEEKLKDWDKEDLEAWGLDIEWDEEIPEAQEDDYEIPDQIETNIVLGDLIEIGEHRLLCGDSTDSDQVAKLMDGEKADMVFTDPPYGMNYKGIIFGKEGLKNDGDNEWEKVLSGAFSNMILYSDNAVFAICFSPSRLDRFFKCTEGIKFKRILTIYKPNRMGFPWQSWILTSEIIALFENGKPVYDKSNYKHDVYTFDYSERPDKEVDHPTVKPLSIVSDIISKTISKRVLDLFLGSGTTMVASHQLKRKCYGMELYPKYCQVIIDRMIKLDPDIEVKINGVEYIKTTEK